MPMTRSMEPRAELAVTISMPDHWTENQRRRALPCAVTSAVLRSYVAETTRMIRETGRSSEARNRLSVFAGYGIEPSASSAS